MDIQTYLKESAKTNSRMFNTDKQIEEVLHGAVGICTEAGEILDTLKKTIYYGRDLDVVNIKEELGDMMWYVAILLRELDLDFDDILDTNIAKLRARYGEKFDEAKSENRDLEAERKVLEK